MQPSRLFRYTMVVCGLLMLIGAILVGIRLAPLHLRGHVAWETLWPLMAAALTTMFEAALVLGAPLAFALAAGWPSSNSTQESAIGSVASMVSRFVWSTVLWLVVAVSVGAYANVRLGAPGRVARGVVQGARAVCEGGDQRHIEPVPFIGARWICSPTAASRIEGELSKNGASARYSARELTVSEDLEYVDFAELEISSSAARGRPQVHLVVQDARVHGTWPWAKAKRMPELWRAFYVASLGATLGVMAGILARRGRRIAPWSVPAAAIVGGVTAWFALGLVDSLIKWHVVGYAAVPIVAAIAMLVVRWLLGQSWVDSTVSRYLESCRRHRIFRRGSES